MEIILICKKCKSENFLNDSFFIAYKEGLVCMCDECNSIDFLIIQRY